MQALGVRAGLIKENAKLLPFVYKWLWADEARSNTARFGNMTAVIQVQRVKRRIILVSHGGQDNSFLKMCVQALSFNAAKGQPLTFSRDELPNTFGPQNQQVACEFVRRE